MVKEGNMDEKEIKLMEEQIAKTLIRFLDQLFHDLENAPKIIFEAEEQAEENEQTINEITSWLFEGRHEDGYKDNNVNN
jgi:hypothetical protein